MTKDINFTVVVAVLLFLKCSKCEIFTNSAELTKVLKLEQDLTRILESHKQSLENALENIETFVIPVKEMYQKENCYPFDTCEQNETDEKILSNPIYNYQVLKRIVVHLKKLENSLKEIDIKQVLGDLRKSRHRNNVQPTETDLQGAAKALNRLQDVYKLNLTDFVKGKIMGLQTTAELSVKDTFYLGRFSHMDQNPQMALKWLEEAVVQVATANDPHQNANNTQSDLSLNGIKLSQITQVLKQVKRRLPPDFERMRLEESELDREDENLYRLGNIPPQSYDPAKYQTIDDRINYKALCQGKHLLPQRERSKLMCYFSTQNSPHFILSPLKVEEEHRQPHLVLTYHDLISDSEINQLLKLAVPKMNQAFVGQDKKISEIRVSRTAWLEDGLPIVDKLSKRFNALTGYQTARCFDKFQEGKMEEYEMLQIANYGIGGHYDLHQDPMFLYKEPHYLAKLGDPKEHDYVTGDRMTTLMLYLSDVPLGGLTAFPRLGIFTKPKKGAAILWSNLKRSGRSDMHMLHGGCPVLLGSKWVANKWVREFANIFTRPCIDNIDV